MSRRLGQHWLANAETTARIVRALAVRPAESILEIGGGRGALTEHLVQTDANLTVVELDEACAEILDDRFGQRIELVQADILEVQLSTLGPGPWAVVGNLPYEATAPIMLWLSAHAPVLSRAVVMIQREVAQRLVAPPGNAARGRLTVTMELDFQVARLFDVPPRDFRPPPKVDSTVIGLVPHIAAPVAEEERAWLLKVVECAFRYRRKTLVRALSSELATRDEVEAALAAAEIEPTLRPESLSLAQWAKLSAVLQP